MKTVLAPLDFLHQTDAVLAEAVSLAQATEARLVLLHVVPPPAIIGHSLALAMTGAEFVATAEKEAANLLLALQRALRDRGVTAHAVHVTGEPVDNILEQAQRLDANFIVMGSHGHVAFYDLIVGSTASGVLKGAKCPVIIVPPGAARGRVGPSRAAWTQAVEA